MVEKFEKPSEAPTAEPSKTKGLTLADASLKDFAPLPQTAANDLTIVDDSSKSAGQQQRDNGFKDGFSGVENLYKNSIKDPVREARFHDRMQAIYDRDPQTFKEFASLTHKIAANPPASPEEVGGELGKIYADALRRQSARGSVDLESPENQNLMGAMSGYMLAGRATFGAGDTQQTKAMVDSLESKIGASKYAHAVIWGDTKEPGMVVCPPNTTYDRYNFSMPN
jgi:hypothetical protein